MTISTMEQLEAVPVGEQVFVNDVRDILQPWQRVEGGFSRLDVTLPTDRFEGSVSAGRVSGSLAPTVGQVYWDSHYADHRYRWVLLAVDEDAEVVTAASFRHRTLRGVNEYAFATIRERWRVEDNQPEWVAPVREVGLVMQAKVVDMASQLRAIPPHPVAVSVDVTGRVQFRASGADVKALLGDQDVIVVRADAAWVRWTKQVQVAKQGTECQCSAVTREDVRPLVPDVATVVWDFRVTGCTEH